MLGDVNGDQLADVAIGAPGEQENRGAVYLFHGAPGLDMSPTHSQRIAGTQLSPRLQYFGQALSGGQDLTQDGLVDLAVGAQGQVLLLRSQPVLKVGVAMRFSPVEVAKAVFQHCREASGALEAGEATVCLTVHKTSPDQLGDVQSSISYDLALDPGRLVSRAIFQETQNQTLTRRKTLGLGRHCETMRLLLPDCVEDVVNPIVLHLNFSLEGQPILSSQNLRPVLATGSQDHFIASLPFEKNCGQDRLCEGDLSISFSFSGLNTLLVGLSLELTVTVTVRNEGEDSYGTAITLYYPAGLSYRRVSGQTQPWQRPLHLACEAVPTESEGLRSTSCSVNHPIFQGGAQGTFVVKFDVSSKASLGDRLLMGASASSENNKPASNKTSFELELPVKYAVYMMITRHEGSTRFFNFSTSAEKSSKEAEHRYRVNNLSLRDVAVSVDFWAPVQLNGAAVWDVAVEAPAQSLPCAREREPPRTSDLSRVPGSPVLDCSVAHCLRFRCHIPSFRAKEELHFTLKGNLSFAWVSQMLQKKVSVVSVAEITFNRAVYSQVPGEEPFMRAQVETVLEEYEEHDPVPWWWAAAWAACCCWLSSQPPCTSLASSSAGTRRCWARSRETWPPSPGRTPAAGLQICLCPSDPLSCPSPPGAGPASHWKAVSVGATSARVDWSEHPLGAEPHPNGGKVLLLLHLCQAAPVTALLTQEAGCARVEEWPHGMRMSVMHLPCMENALMQALACYQR